VLGFANNFLHDSSVILIAFFLVILLLKSISINFPTPIELIFLIPIDFKAFPVTVPCGSKIPSLYLINIFAYIIVFP